MSSLLYFHEFILFSNISNFSIKSFQFLSKKNSHVTHSTIVSSRPHHLYAKTGIQAQKLSIGTIQKSSSPENTSHFEFCNK
jgi:hypothetical protein